MKVHNGKKSGLLQRMIDYLNTDDSPVKMKFSSSGFGAADLAQFREVARPGVERFVKTIEKSLECKSPEQKRPITTEGEQT